MLQCSPRPTQSPLLHHSPRPTQSPCCSTHLDQHSLPCCSAHLDQTRAHGQARDRPVGVDDTHAPSTAVVPAFGQQLASTPEGIAPSPLRQTCKTCVCNSRLRLVQQGDDEGLRSSSHHWQNDRRSGSSYASASSEASGIKSKKASANIEATYRYSISRVHRSTRRGDIERRGGSAWECIYVGEGRLGGLLQ